MPHLTPLELLLYWMAAHPSRAKGFAKQADMITTIMRNNASINLEPFGIHRYTFSSNFCILLCVSHNNALIIPVILSYFLTGEIKTWKTRQAISNPCLIHWVKCYKVSQWSSMNMTRVVSPWWSISSPQHGLGYGLQAGGWRGRLRPHFVRSPNQVVGCWNTSNLIAAAVASVQEGTKKSQMIYNYFSFSSIGHDEEGHLTLI